MSEESSSKNGKDERRLIRQPTSVVYESDAFDPETYRPRTNEPNRCVGAFGFGTDRQQPTRVYEMLRKYGPIETTDFIKDATTGKYRGYGFLHFRYLQDAIDAVNNSKMKGMIVGGLRIRIDFLMVRAIVNTLTSSSSLSAGDQSRRSRERQESSRKHPRVSSSRRDRSRSYSPSRQGRRFQKDRLQQ